MMMHNYLGDNLFDEDWARYSTDERVLRERQFPVWQARKTSAAYRCKRNRRCD